MISLWVVIDVKNEGTGEVRCVSTKICSKSLLYLWNPRPAINCPTLEHLTSNIDMIFIQTKVIRNQQAHTCEDGPLNFPFPVPIRSVLLPKIGSGSFFQDWTILLQSDIFN